tara:strand:- start:661 stop:912 length:252 start_codon:yes stop_codon:yes gene_type:complete
MKYEWEADALDLLHELIEKINHDKKYIDSNFYIIGIAVENEVMGEGAYLSMLENDRSILLSDVMNDVCNGANQFYHKTIKNKG